MTTLVGRPTNLSLLLAFLPDSHQPIGLALLHAPCHFRDREQFKIRYSMNSYEDWRMDLEKNQAKVALSFYEAAENPELWPHAMQKVSKILGDAGLNFCRVNGADKIVEQKCDFGYESEASSILYETDIIINCHIFQKMMKIQHGGFYHWTELTTYDEFMDSILWNEWVSKTLTFPHTTARFPVDHDVSFQLNVAHYKGFQPFDDAERCLWNSLVLPHLWQALRLEHKLAESKQLRDTGFEALDRLSTAVVSLSDQGLVLDVNQTAGTIFAQRDGIEIHRKRLVCANQKETDELNSKIAGAIQTGLGKVTGAGGFMMVTRRSMKRRFRIAIFPLLNGDLYRSGSKPSRVLMIIDDPEKRPGAPAHVLQRLYGVSRAQSRVLVLLLKGLRREQIADELCLSKNTIKTHEREIFERLDVSSRSDLIRLVLPGLGSLQL